MNNPAKTNHNAVKLLVAALLIVSGFGWTFYRVSKARPGAVANNGVTDEFRRPDPAEMDKTRREMYAYAGITSEQQQQLEELQKKARELWEQRRAQNTTAPQRMGPPPGGPGGGGPMGMRVPRELQAELDKILTKDQQQKMGEYIQQRFQQARSQREARTKAALGEDQYKVFQEKMRERRGGRGGGPRGGGQSNRGTQAGQRNSGQGGRP